MAMSRLACRHLSRSTTCDGCNHLRRWPAYAFHQHFHRTKITTNGDEESTLWVEAIWTMRQDDIDAMTKWSSWIDTTGWTRRDIKIWLGH